MPPGLSKLLRDSVERVRKSAEGTQREYSMKKLVSAVLCAATMVAALAVPAEAAPNPASNLPHGFDLQAHRGGMAEYTESSLAAYAHALKVGVTTLEMDIYLSKDGKPMIWHDLVIKPQKCRDLSLIHISEPTRPY